jgi:hypothetical protein
MMDKQTYEGYLSAGSIARQHLKSGFVRPSLIPPLTAVTRSSEQAGQNLQRGFADQLDRFGFRR